MTISIGIDAAKHTHWACAVDEAGRVVLDRAVENDPHAIEDFVAALRSLGGDPVIGLDVVGSFAGFLEAVLLAEGYALVHAPGIAVNRAGQGFAGGERKSDPRDARTIAELVRTRELRPIAPDSETVVAIRLKVGRRRELVAEQTRRLARLRDLLCGIHPGLERLLDVTTKAPLALLSRFVTPAEIRRAGKARLIAQLRKTPQARDRIARIDRDLEELLTNHPDGALIRSLPGMGAVLAAEFIARVGDIGRFPSADALASAAGLAPVLRQSGRSAARRRAFGGDKARKRVVFQSTFCAVMTGDPLSRAFHDRKRREGKHRTQALIALARRRITVLWTMLRSRQNFDPTRKAA